MKRTTVSTIGTNALANFAISYANSTSELRGHRLTWGDICDEQSRKYKCQCCDEFISEYEGIACKDGSWVCNNCRILNKDHEI